MTYVVTENCINCKHTSCVEVCPTDSFKEGPNFLVIDPNLCVDCNVCVSECPVGAIYAEENVPAEQIDFIELNAELAKCWPQITVEKPALPDADSWNGVEDKLLVLLR